MKYLLVIAVLAATFISCLTTPETQVPKRVALLYAVEDLGETFESQTDSITIREFKFIVSKFELLAADSVKIQTDGSLSSMVFSYNHEMSEERLILSAPLGFEDIDLFKEYKMFVDRAKSSDEILDNDFYGTSQNYSVIATGRFNGEEFTYRSGTDFSLNFDLDAVQLSSLNPSLVIRKELSVKKLFIDPETGKILSPNLSANRAKIDSLFKSTLHIKAGAENIM